MVFLEDVIITVKRRSSSPRGQSFPSAGSSFFGQTIGSIVFLPLGVLPKQSKLSKLPEFVLSLQTLFTCFEGVMVQSQNLRFPCRNAQIIRLAYANFISVACIHS